MNNLYLRMILSFFQVDNRCVLLQPFLHAVHVVFGCDNRRSVVDFGEARSFIPVDPLLQRGNAPHLRVVEHGVEPPDTLAEGYEQRFIGDFLVYFIRFHILAFYGRLLPPRNFLIRQVQL